MTLNEFQQLIIVFSASKDLAPVKYRFESLLTTIEKNISYPQTNDNFNNYLIFKQIETAINEIEKIVAEKDTPAIKKLADSSPYIAVIKAKHILLEQQYNLYPFYLATVLLRVIDQEGHKATGEGLSNKIKDIINHPIESAEKINKITNALTAFIKSNHLTLYIDKSKTLKHTLRDILDTEQAVNMKRIYHAKFNK